MDEDTAGVGPVDASDATVLLDLEGLAVRAVQRAPDGERVVHLETAEETAAACPVCGVLAWRVKGYVRTGPRDLPCGGGGLQLVWRKRRWHCDQPGCPRASFTESVPAVPARARLTTRLRAHAGNLVVDGICATVSAAGRATGLSWPTAMDAARNQAAPLADEAPAAVEVLGIDEVRRGRPKWRAPDQPPEPPPAAAQPAASQPAAAQPAAATAKARVLADRWHVGFTDISGGQGMLAQVEGRTADDVAYWLASQPAAWRDRVRYVAIDMCTVFVSAVRRYLPHAQLVVDHFHLVKLANDAVAEVRRRITTTTRGRRGRDSDPEWKVRNLLGRNQENLTPKAFAKMWNTLVDLGAPGVTILTAWVAKEELRSLLALAGTGPDRSQISSRLTRFFTWCADSTIPELHRLAATIDRWWPCIEPFLHTKITNAASEGYNRVVKLDARNAFGYRNPHNQRLRTRCATTRRARGCLDPGQLRRPAKVRRQRADFHHKTALTLVRDHDLIVVEDLRVANMSRSASGTLEEPGTNVAAKSGLNRSILDAGWSAFTQILTAKAESAGRQLISVNPTNTSRTCPTCGHIAAANRPTQATFRCVACGHSGHADVVAAGNILRRGLASQPKPLAA